MRSACIACVLEADPPIERLRIPANPANSLRPISVTCQPLSRLQNLKSTPSASTVPATTQRHRFAQRCGEEAHAERCRRHRRQSHGRQAEVLPAPRLVSTRPSAHQRQTRLTTAQASPDRVAPQHPQEQPHPQVLPRYHQYPILSTPSRTATRQTTQR